MTVKERCGRPRIAAYALQLVDAVRFVWEEDADGQGARTVGEGAWRAFRARPEGGWDVSWCDGAAVRRLILPSALDAIQTKTMLVRWHLNRADLARDKEGRVPDSVRAWAGIAVEVEDGALSRRCSVLLRRPVPASWTLVDALEAMAPRTIKAI